MSSGLMRWLLNLDVIPADAEGLRLAWERPWPGWLWMVLLLLAALFAAWSYSRLEGRRTGRLFLAGARLVIVVLALVLLSGPMLELPRESREEDWVLLLVDRSESMTIADLTARDGSRLTRDAQMSELLTANNETWMRLDEERRLVWLGFNRGAYDLPVPEGDDAPASPVLDEPTGQRTRLSTSLEQALQRAAARPLSGIVVFSDGRTSDPPTRDLLRRLQADGVRVHVVPIGSPDAVGDLAIQRIDAPDRAFVRDKVPVTVELDRLGSEGAGLAATVKLVDRLSGEVLDEAEVAADDRTREVTLTAEPALAGSATWEVIVETRGPDLIPENNTRTFELELIDRPLRVLFVDGYPRWEYRYVKNLLVREKSIESSVMLLSADRDFAQEGNMPITRLPRSPEEFAEFDVIILGDVPATFFSPDQLEMIRENVARRGSGLLWIGGEQSMPNTYTGTALADLLPMRGSLTLPRLPEPVNMMPTPLADRLGVLRLATASEVGWPSELLSDRQPWSRLQFAQRIEPSRLKPAAEVLAQTVQTFEDQQYPLVVHMRYGSGQTTYVASDEIWRWRFGRGERLPEQFWVQMLRMLGRDRIISGDDVASLTINPHRLSTGQPMQIDLRVLDAELAERLQDDLAAVIETADGRVLAEIDLRRTAEGEARYGATFVPEASGQITVRLVAPELAGLDVRTEADIFQPEDELRRPETDHDLLAGLAAETGGRVLKNEDIALLPDPALLPNRSVVTESSITEPIWDSPLGFGLLMLLLVGEWIGRKVLRLI